jgi:hypothetical protein
MRACDNQLNDQFQKLDESVPVIGHVDLGIVFGQDRERSNPSIQPFRNVVFSFIQDSPEDSSTGIFNLFFDTERRLPARFSGFHNQHDAVQLV